MVEVESDRLWERQIHQASVVLDYQVDRCPVERIKLVGAE